MTTGRAMHVPLREQLRRAALRLDEAGVPSPRNDAEILAAHVLSIERSELVTAPEPEASFAVDYAELVDRRAGREPLQHIIGQAHFRHVALRVGPGVFVPRPETELTAGAAIDEARALADDGRRPLVVDMYAGSGAIAISVAHEVRTSVVHAVESENAAFAWLRRNAADLPVVLHHGDVGGIAERRMPDLLGTVDVVVANPPYVPSDAVIRDPEAGTHDPAAALWPGPDGLSAMRVLEREAAQLLRPGGLVVAEHADVQGEAAPAVFTGTGRWSDVADHPDLNGRPRFLTARRVR